MEPGSLISLTWPELVKINLQNYSRKQVPRGRNLLEEHRGAMTFFWPTTGGFLTWK